MKYGEKNQPFELLQTSPISLRSETQIQHSLDQLNLEYSTRFQELELSPLSQITLLEQQANTVTILRSTQRSKLVPEGQKLWYDLASLTKMITNLNAIFLLQSNQIHLSDKISTLHPSGELQPEATLYDLITHRSGLELRLGMFDKTQEYEAKTVENWYRDIRNYKLDQQRGVSNYTDGNMIILGQIMQDITGMKITNLNKKLLKDFDLDFRYNPLENGVPSRDIVATESVFRNGRLATPGIVQDEKARWMGGEAAHAGLFATHQALVRFAEYWLHNTWGFDKHYQILSLGQPPKQEEKYSYGLVWRRGIHSNYTNTTGFTGQTLIFDRERNRFFVHSNQLTYPERSPEKMKQLRAFNQSVFDT